MRNALSGSGRISADAEEKDKFIRPVYAIIAP